MVKEKIKTILLILLIIGIIGGIWFLGGSSEAENDSVVLDDVSLDFISDFEDYLDSLDDNVDMGDFKNVLAAQLVDIKKSYGSGNSIDNMSQQLLEELANSNAMSPEDLRKNLKTIINEMRTNAAAHYDPDKIIPPTNEVKIRSTTVCDTYGSGSRYCLDGSTKFLNGSIYISDSESTKWVIALHGNLGSGPSIFVDVGKDWYDRGYNVLAPDLRGYANSSGDAAFGYLDSLDIYDWIKYLNDNYGVSSITLHGVSVGAATALQVATNPDFSKTARFNYHVNNYVLDSGYTSFVEFVRGLLMSGNTTMLTVVFEESNINMDDFKSDMADVLYETGFNVDPSMLDDLFNGTISYSDFDNMLMESNEQIYNDAIQLFQNYYSLNCQGLTLEQCAAKFTGNRVNMRKNVVSSNGAKKRLADADMGSLLTDDVLKETILRNPSFGFTVDNFDTYQDAFSGDRNFDVTDKILIIHSQSDTVVNPANSDLIERKAQAVNTISNYYWRVKSQPHAFILLGLEKEKYQKLVNKFIDCVENNSKCSAVKA